MHSFTRMIRPITIGVTCDRCQAEISTNYADSHYKCVVCENYDLCMECGEKGAYCENDTHEWIQYRFEQGKRRPVSTRMTSKDIRYAFPSKQLYPSVFKPIYTTPTEQFSKDHRFISKTNPREIMIYTDGACARNGANNPRGGFAFVYRPSAYTQAGEITHTGTIYSCLETRGPTGLAYPHTSNRAELRAVIAALHYRDWSKDCNRSWRSLVIATDSEYVAVNATTRVELWENRGWKLADGKDVKNQDLWRLLMTQIRQLHNDGMHVSFWKIGREFNERADEFAKSGVNHSETPLFTKLEADGPKFIRVRVYQTSVTNEQE